MHKSRLFVLIIPYPLSEVP